MSKLSKEERLDAAEAALYRLEGKEYLQVVDLITLAEKRLEIKAEDALLLVMEVAIAIESRVFDRRR